MARNSTRISTDEDRPSQTQLRANKEAAKHLLEQGLISKREYDDICRRAGGDHGIEGEATRPRLDRPSRRMDGGRMTGKR